jgi:ATP-binding cassette subfamily B protein
MLLRSAINSGMRKDGVLILASQRVSTVKDCDLILVLDDGVLIGKGKHDELMENCEEYRLIANSQMGGDVE